MWSRGGPTFPFAVGRTSAYSQSPSHTVEWCCDPYGNVLPLEDLCQTLKPAALQPLRVYRDGRVNDRDLPGHPAFPCFARLIPLPYIAFTSEQTVHETHRPSRTFAVLKPAVLRLLRVYCDGLAGIQACSRELVFPYVARRVSYHPHLCYETSMRNPSGPAVDEGQPLSATYGILKSSLGYLF
ncbi:hypothetical protein PLICRDRAFT_178744 [Plicaturopsis crispa FD-325 SS-3]|nr:hypothetical protein PLICRDRAFT_178744 [Plicaturopsis crispa FD-325 SS-3]